MALKSRKKPIRVSGPQQKAAVRTQKITIIGAGMAGLTAALRLAERGYEVTIFERDAFIGGKFRATEWVGKASKRNAFHEHSYHMFLNWYHNFWQIAKEIGAIDNFVPLTSVKFLRSGEFPRMNEVVNFGSAATVLQNLRSGVIPTADMFLYMYSVVDLLSTPIREDKYRDLISVNEFASDKFYATEASASMYDEYLAKTFAIASYETSAQTFRTFLEYGTYCPEPLYWGLNGDCYTRFLRLLQSRLLSLGVTIYFNHEASEILLGADGSASAVVFNLWNPRFSPSLSEMSAEEAKHQPKCTVKGEKKDQHKVDGPLILAVPHAILSELLSPELLNRDPELGESAKLRSVPMASVHLHLNDKFARRLERIGAKLPQEPVVLLDSKYKLSFVANSSLWPDSKDTYLNIVASDSRPLNYFKPPEAFTEDRDWPRDASEPGLSIDDPRTTLDYILHEFRRYVHFENGDIDLELLQIDRNVGRELFINEVGSWKWRPQTVTRVPNLFLASDYCKNFIDVVCLEGAVVSGLQAAECIRQQSGIGTPIKMTRPRRYPSGFFWPLKVALAPYAAGAKLWSMVGGLMAAENEKPAL